ncbi:tetratricopeptide repeat protein [Ectothiorhodospiraceae bacterium 2226]|nr:tetratricopeptide repeat protein [Ectothiorhodospiraceae bacterium 2226]
MQTDDEQLEALKRWWKEYGRSVVLGVVLGGAIAGGAWWWMEQQERQAESASMAYQSMLHDLEQGEYARVMEQGQGLIGEYSRSAYAGLAALAVARAAVAQDELDVARAQLAWAADNARTDEARTLARLHLARLLLDAGEHQEALARLEGEVADPLRPAFDEARGDVYLAMGERAQARQAYAAALEGVEGRPSQLLQMKYDDVADAATQEDAAS